MSVERPKFFQWISRCEAIAGSASYGLNGYPQLQVKVLGQELKAAASAGSIGEHSTLPSMNDGMLVGIYTYWFDKDELRIMNNNGVDAEYNCA